MKRKIILSFGLILTFLSLYLVYAVGDTQAVNSCTGGTGACSVTNYNSNSTSIGHTIGRGDNNAVAEFETSTSGSGDTINSVQLNFRHGGDSGISGNVEITYRSKDAATTYCTSTTANSASDTYVELTPTGCSWTAERLDDLEIYIDHTDGGGPQDLFVYFAQIQVDYTISSSNDCTYVSGDWIIDDGSDCELTTSQDIGVNHFAVLNGSMKVTSTGGLVCGSAFIDGEDTTDGGTGALHIENGGGFNCG